MFNTKNLGLKALYQKPGLDNITFIFPKPDCHGLLLLLYFFLVLCGIFVLAFLFPILIRFIYIPGSEIFYTHSSNSCYRNRRHCVAYVFDIVLEKPDRLFTSDELCEIDWYD